MPQILINSAAIANCIVNLNIFFILCRRSSSISHHFQYVCARVHVHILLAIKLETEYEIFGNLQTDGDTSPIGKHTRLTVRRLRFINVFGAVCGHGSMVIILRNSEHEINSIYLFYNFFLLILFLFCSFNSFLAYWHTEEHCCSVTVPVESIGSCWYRALYSTVIWFICSANSIWKTIFLRRKKWNEWIANESNW